MGSVWPCRNLASGDVPHSTSRSPRGMPATSRAACRPYSTCIYRPASETLARRSSPHQWHSAPRHQASTWTVVWYRRQEIASTDCVYALCKTNKHTLYSSTPPLLNPLIRLSHDVINVKPSFYSQRRAHTFINNEIRIAHEFVALGHQTLHRLMTSQKFLKLCVRYDESARRLRCAEHLSQRFHFNQEALEYLNYNTIGHCTN